tara:strand:+ start:506 stop:1351 length:846 start_codon:yes stop_codon:yes gene_type:complete
MIENRYWKIFRRDFRLTRVYCGLSVSLLGFNWLLYSINAESRLPFLERPQWSEILSIGLGIFLTFIATTPIIGIVNYLLTRKKRRILNQRAKLRAEFDAEFAALADLPKIVDFGRSLVGDSHIDLETLSRRHGINDKIVTCLYSSPKTDKRELLGYYIMYPLTLEAYKDIHTVNIKNGRDLKDRHISKNFTDAAALYIGMAGGKGGHAEAYVIDEMLEQIGELLHRGHLKALCTRGATKEGKEAIRKFGFQKLADPSEISCLPLSKDVLEEKRIKRHLAYR